MSKLFISHSSQDDGFVRELRWTLADLKQDAWIDSRELRGGDPLWSEIQKAISLQATVAGSRDRSLADAPDLDHTMAAEILVPDRNAAKARSASGPVFEQGIRSSGCVRTRSAGRIASTAA